LFVAVQLVHDNTLELLNYFNTKDTEVTEVTKTVLGSTQLVVNGTPSKFEINSDTFETTKNSFCVCGLGGFVSFVTSVSFVLK
jgi:hypothetical protein